MKTVVISIILWLSLVSAFGLIYTKLQGLQKQIDILTNATSEVADALEVVDENFKAVKQNISDLRKIIDEQRKEINNLNSKVKILEDKVGQRGLVNPSYSELVQFMAEDKTDEKDYVSENNAFICTDFANTFVSHFRNKGYYSCIAILYLQDGAHAIVAVNTTDRGLVYLEPQNDEIITNLEVGEDYCEKMDWDCSWEIKSIKSCFGSV